MDAYKRPTPDEITRAASFRARLEMLFADVETAKLESVMRLVAEQVGTRRRMEGIQFSALQELASLSEFIRLAKAEVSDLNADDITQRHIPLANGELDAIGSHLEEATGTILDSCETIESAIEGEAPDADAVMGAVTQIYEACNFQDLTGQRITKIVKTLNTIETRIQALHSALAEIAGEEVAALAEEAAVSGEGQPVPLATPATQEEADAKLLNGPQRPGLAISQSDIDALLGG